MRSGQAMATGSPLPVRGRLERPPVVVGSAVVLFVAIFLARQLNPHGADTLTFLYVLPVALLALELGLRGGLAAAGVAVGLILLSATSDTIHLGPGDVLIHAATLVAVGGVAGHFSDRMRRGRRYHQQLLESGLALAETTDPAALPMLVAHHASALVPAAGVRVTIDGLPTAELGHMNGHRLLVGMGPAGAQRGTLELSNRARRSFDADERLALDQLALQASVAVENQHLQTVKREQAELATELHRAREYTAEQARRLELVLASQETERREVAHELHEQVAQALGAIQLGLAAVERDLGSADTRPQIEFLRSHLADTLRALRDLAVGLRPPTLDQLGLVPALRGLVDRASARSGREVLLEVDGLTDRLPADLETTVYRVVDEILGVLSGPATIRVTLGDSGSEVTLLATQFGSAATIPTVDELARIRARLELTSGTLAVLDGEPQTLEARIPVVATP
jgi:signal transduction histidine kinase